VSHARVRLDLLVQAAAGAIIPDSNDKFVSGLTYDSRLVQPGDLFAALPGADLDGHDYIRDAERRGASALLVERPVATPLPQIVVPDSRAALAAVAATFHAHPSRALSVIGITGTDGKTTTSFMIDHLLRHAGVSTGMIGTVGIRVGDSDARDASRQTTPESSDVQAYLRQMVDVGVDWAIVEATSHGLAMHRLDGVRFCIGAVTNITHEHLDFHGSVENYRRAKAMLLERVAAETGVVVTNADDPGAVAVEPFAHAATVVRYGITNADVDLRAVDIHSGPTGSQLELVTQSHGRVTIDLPFIGEFNVANALCAMGVALAAGLDVQTIAAGMATTPPVPGRMAQVDAGQPFSVIVDYAHTPDALGKVLRLLRRLHPEGRLIAVFGSAGERDIEKRPLQGAISANLADVTVVTSEDPRFEDADAIIAQIAAGAEAAGARRGETLFTRTERRDAIELALSLASPGDCVLLAGKGHEGSIIWGREKRPWDEAGVARELLQEAGYSSQAT
jgi:UDP-N-acetylmuramoyl-L-alanyl-D-glutamate--2,6-diaminopimelate ligase